MISFNSLFETYIPERFGQYLYEHLVLYLDVDEVRACWLRKVKNIITIYPLRDASLAHITVVPHILKAPYAHLVIAHT